MSAGWGRLIWAVVAVCALAGGYALTVWGLGVAAARQYENGDYGSAAATAQWQKRLAVLERHKGYYNAGTARAASGELEQARGELEQALRLSPPADECRVIVNLAYVLEALGDAAHADQDARSGDALYQEALTLIEEAPEHCSDGEEAGDLDEAAERLTEKQAESDEDPEQGEEAAPEDEDGQAELEQRNRDAAREQFREDEHSRQQGGGTGRAERPW